MPILFYNGCNTLAVLMLLTSTPMILLFEKLLLMMDTVKENNI